MLCACLWLSALPLAAAEFHGQVKFGGLPVPGATVTASQGEHKVVAVADQQGNYLFPDLADGVWNIQVEMLGFTPIKQDVTIMPGAPAADWDLKMLSYDQIKAIATTAPPPAAISYASPAGEPVANTAVPTLPNGKKAVNGKNGAAAPANQNSFQRADLRASNTDSNAQAASNAVPASSQFSNQDPNELSQSASDGFLVNGSQNNGAASPFAQAAAFGNNRRGSGSLYQFGLGFIMDNSALDARNYSLTGQDTPKPGYNHMTLLGNFAGPIRIPRLWKSPPTVFVNYQFVRNRNASTQPALMPLAAERSGDFSQAPSLIYDPTTGAPFPNNVIPASRISQQAQSLLNFYPLPNFDEGAGYNYQVPLVGLTEQNNLQARFNKSVTTKDQIFGNFGLQRVSNNNPNVFGFTDKATTLGLNGQLSVQHRFTPRTFGTLQVQYSRFSTRSTPYFENRENVAEEAGITGTNQDPTYWGPPTLSFASGIYSLSDGLPAYNRNQTMAESYNTLWIHGRHNVTYGGDYRRQEFNQLAQQNPRGAFTFTGAATSEIVNGVAVPGTGSDFADFLLGIPDTSSLAFGNADKYFRSSMADAFVNDDWRIGPSLTLNAGLRWDYGSPISELYGRLVNLDIAPGYTAIAPVLANDPVGPLTGEHYPNSLIRPDLHEFEPNVGLAWRPFPASSVVIRAGYSLRYNTSVYQQIASQMAQQSPLSTNLIASNAVTPLTLADAFYSPPGAITNNFAIDPNFKVGYSQNWQASLQRDLPGSLVMVATYNGIKGTRAVQEFYPNTYPIGVTNPCPTCPSGYIYETSNGNSTREAGQLQLRRRLHSGLTSTLQYTYSKSIDDASLGGRSFFAGSGAAGAAAVATTAVVAQNWLDLSAERGLSNFDQRQLLSWSTQYTTGMGTAGGSLLSGWRGTLFKEWTVISTINAGTGLPLTPLYDVAVPGTGFTGIRPDYTGASVTEAPAGLSLNPLAYTAPVGHWGNAARDSITGPAQFTFNASLGRTFRFRDRYTLDLRIDSVNPINHVTYTAWNTTINSPQFGLPAAANAMRSLQTTLRLRF